MRREQIEFSTDGEITKVYKRVKKLVNNSGEITKVYKKSFYTVFNKPRGVTLAKNKQDFTESLYL